MTPARRRTVPAALITLAVLLGGCATATHSTSAPAPTPPAAPAHAAAAGGATVTLTVPAANRSGAFTQPRRLVLPRGFTAQVWALVTDARLETWSPQGRLLVSDPGDGRIVQLTPRSRRSDPPAQRTVVSGLNQPQGMAFDRIGRRTFLYVAETDAIDRYVWLGDHVGTRTVLVPHLPSGNDHALKNVVVGPGHTLFVDIGSTSNASPSPAASPPYASVVKYTAAGRFVRVWATGVRNGDGLSFAPDGALWTAVNGRDQIPYPWHRAYGGHADAYSQVMPAYVNDHPADQVAKLTAGRNLGWPYCNADPDRQPGVAGTALNATSLPFVNDQDNNADGSKLNCAALAPLDVGLPAHSAPLGLHFLTASRLPRRWRAGAVVAVHGSWDRTPPRAPAVLWMPWITSRHTLGAPRTIVSGFQSPNGDRWGRTVDAVPGPDGALYVSDDTAGAIYRIVP